ncbi:hypothetical protein T484DRAFT_1824732 [Baffinella frigidus]|nr:hypothetical protein T484DRAFT_1824732 [Cryptophyta sp. CCMP2293]
MIGEVDEWVFLEEDTAPHQSALHAAANAARPPDAPAGQRQGAPEVEVAGWRPPSWEAASGWYLQGANQVAETLLRLSTQHSVAAPYLGGGPQGTGKEGGNQSGRSKEGAGPATAAPATAARGGEMEPDEVLATWWPAKGACRSVLEAANQLPNVSILSAPEQELDEGGASDAAKASEAPALRALRETRRACMETRTRAEWQGVQGASSTLACTAVQRSLMARGAGDGGTWLATSVSRAMAEMGPRAVQQDAAAVFDIKGTTPVVVVCDGHGSIPLRCGKPEFFAGGKQAAEIATQAPEFLAGGKQAADIATLVVTQYMKKYGNNFLLHSADIFMHAAFVRAHHVLLDQILAGAATEQGGLSPSLPPLPSALPPPAPSAPRADHLTGVSTTYVRLHQIQPAAPTEHAGGHSVPSTLIP